MSLKSRYRPRLAASKHSNLSTQQRRLRHLTCIIGRNIDASLVPVTRQTSKCSLLSLYFTIHAHDDANIILYKSETIDNSLNPNWREFDSQIFSRHPSYNKTSSIIVCVWGARKTNDLKIIFCYKVNFSGLVYSREQLRSHDLSYETNCLLFRMFGGYYTVPTTNLQTDISNQSEVGLQNGEALLCSCIKVHQAQVCTSYKKASLLRAHFTMKAIHETRQQVIQVKNHMGESLTRNEVRRTKSAQREALIFRNNMLLQELRELREKLLSERNSFSTELEAIQNRDSVLNKRQYDLEQYISDMKVCHSAHIERREMLLKVSAHLNFRRRQLAAELSYVYPILELPINEGNKREFAIAGVRLPNSEDFLGEDQLMLGVAIGNVAHLVFMMAKFMELPLRYPIRPMGSRSSVVDLVTDKLTDKQREFPLYLKGKEKFQFHYGVFLLNKNIAQLRYHNGLGTADLRNTLTNLKHLLEAKYGVRVVMKQSSVLSSFNKSAQMASRTISLPATSSPFDRNSLLVPDSVDNESELSPVERVERPQSKVISSGLPSVHVKAQQQHRFIARKSVNRKVRKAYSLPGTQESPTQDLIEVPFEDLILRTMDGKAIADALSVQKEVMSPITESGNNESTIDCAVDCLQDQEDSYVTVNSDRHRDSISRQFSDALIIPDPFEREHDDPFSPTDILD